MNDRLKEPYSFDVFAAYCDERSVNFGLMVTYRQRWEPVAYQAGQLVKTVTLAPREERAFATKRLTKTSTATVRGRQTEAQRHFESTETTRDVADIVEAAKSSLGFQYEGKTSGSLPGIGSVDSTWTVSRNSEQSSQETRQAFREAVRKAAQDSKETQKLEVTTTESTESSFEESGKLVNPNDEIPVTYLFYELQRRYRVSERIHKFTPVILVAQEVPAPNEITRAWFLQYDWILAKNLLDESFRPALQYLAMEAAGAETKLDGRG